MSARIRTPAATFRPVPPASRPPFRRKAMCRLIALALFGGGVAHAAATPPPFSAAWLAARQPGATPSSSDAVPRTDARPASVTPGNALQQQRVQQSIQNLNKAAAALATQMQQQATAAATVPRVSGVPDGLAEGGLKPAAALAADPTLWQNARQPTDTVAANAKHTVEVKQTAKKAILTWDSFNVGRDTTLYINQSAGNLTAGGNDWVALNRITDPTAKPSTILGQIKAEGTVYLLNRNGMVFGGGSQVNVHSLIASSLDIYSPDRFTSNARFLEEGFASTASGGPQMSVLQSAFAPGAGHDVTIEKGAGITTGAQGFAIVAAPNVVNEGAVVADDGQAILAAGTVFDASLSGNSGRILLSETSSGAYTEGRGTVSNRGLVQARRGEIDLTGYGVAQDGVVMASTSIAAPGTITITGQSGRGSRSGPVTFGAPSVTTILPEKDGATTSSTAAADTVFMPGKITVTGGNVSLAPGALIEAPGATVALTAIRDSSLTGEGVVANAGRVYVDANATIDVSGLADVSLPMSALLVNIPRIGQNELANSPLLRNGFLYTQKNVLIDRSQSGTRTDGLDWIGSPILNVTGYVDNVPRDISQMLTRGGSIALDGNEVITRSGSSLRLDGGYLAYQAGWITTPNLLGADGRVYDISSADPDVQYIGFAGQYTSTHARWGVSQTYNSPLLGGSRRWAEGFVSGSDAGDLAVHARSGLVLDGEMTAQATVGERQAANGTPPEGGTFVFDTTPVSLAPRQVIPGVRLQQSSRTLESLMPGFTGGDDLADLQAPSDDGQTWLLLAANTLGNAGFSALTINNRDGAIEETEGTRVTVSPGGSVSMAAGRIDIHGSIVAPSGSITLKTQTLAQFADHANPAPDISLTDGALLSTRGLWVNDTNRAGTDVAGRQFVDGGNITLATSQSYQGDVEAQVDQTGSIRLARGSTIDVSSGGYVGIDGRVAMANGVPLGRGGNVSLLLYDVPSTLAFGDQKPPTALDSGYLVMDGAINAYGFAGGGTLALHAAQVQVGGDPAAMTQPNGLYLAPSFFQGQGFDNYVLHAVTDATVTPGTQVQVRRANRVADLDALRFLASGADVDAANGASVFGYLDPYQRWATRGTDTGQGPGFSLVAGDYLGWPSRGSAGGQSAAPVYAGVSGSAAIGAGAQVVVDAGGTIALASPGAVVVDGTLRAPGGSVALTNSKAGNTVQVQPSRIWLGATGVLDASGVSLIDTQATPATLASTDTGTRTPERATPRTGTVLDGGRVTLDSPYTGYVVAANGSVIDVSGARDTYDLPTGTRRLNGTTVDDTPTAVWSDAGNITIGAVSGLYMGAALSAHAGDSRGEGGSLAIVPRDEVGGDAWAPVTMLIRSHVEDAPGYASSVTDTGASAQGVLELGADRLQGSGIASLSLGADNAGTVTNTLVPVTFAGDVDLAVGRSISVYALAYRAVGGDATGLEPVNGFRSGNGAVHLRAPYVHLAGGAPSVAAAEAGHGSLSVDANAIDLGGALDLQGWGSASFDATGDLRFTGDALLAYDTAGARVPGMLFSTGDLTFRAAQVYPATDYRFVIDANASGIADAQGDARETTVAFLPGGASSAPLSAGGALLVSADHIEQQGTVRAPAGSLILGVSDPQAAASGFGLGAGYAPLVATTSVHLAPGSVTSVSLGGATVPYGSTVDGVDWRYSGAANVSSASLTAPPSKQVELHGTALALDSGASIDLAGGGQLQAAEFVAGVGGTRDVLASSGTGAAVYAILPGFNGPVAAQDNAFASAGGTQPRVGESVYLSGMPGLPAGMYTLLPAQYAQLSGAYRIVQDTAAHDSVLGRSSRMADGTYAVSGYVGDALSGARDARNTTFLVQSAPVWQQYSQYRFTDADSFFTHLASKKGQVAAQRPMDAGRLMIDAGQRLDLGATLATAPGKGGRTSQVDIAGQAIQILGAGNVARDGYLGVSADGLTGLGAGSLLIGGTRSAAADGDHVDVKADSVLLSNDAAHPLSGQEILLVAAGSADGEGVFLDDGSTIQGRGDANNGGNNALVFGRNAGVDASGTPVAAISGDGSLLRVSQNGASSVTRLGLPTDVTALGRLTIGAGASVDGGNALTLDATGRMRVDDSASLSGKAIDATANRVSFVADGALGADDGLSIGSRTVAQLRSADSVVLRSRGEIDFVGPLDIAFDRALTLSAGAMVGDGSDVRLRAGTLTFANVLGAAAGATLAGSGTFDVQANEVDFGAGTLALHGFNAFNASAAQGFVAQGQGGVDFGAAAVALSAPVFVADGGGATTLGTTGTMSLRGAAGSALTGDGLGGSLTLQAASIDDAMNLTATSGTLRLRATDGDLTVAPGTVLDASGAVRTFFDTAAYSAGGNVTLDAGKGNIVIGDGAAMRFAGTTQGGDAGTFHAVAGGNLLLGGSYDGHALAGNRGGYFTVGSGGTLDLDTLAALAASAGATGLVDISSGQGDLTLSAGHLLTAQKVYLYANGGTARVDGRIDASAPAGSRIEVWGRQGVDIEGQLDAHTSIPAQRGGDVVLGTTGTSNGQRDPTRGYEQVDRQDAGYIHIGANAGIDVSGGSGDAFSGGRVSMRAPLLTDGDVPITVDAASAIKGARDVTLEPYAVWSTQDASTGAQHFDGIVDPAGWYANGGATMVAGKWTDASGKVLAAPVGDDQVAIYLSKYFFFPDAVNADHAGFYGYLGGDIAKGPGTLMGFVQQPGFSFGSRFADIRNVNVRPGIELRNPSDGPAQGDIAVLTNWNLGAGVTGSDGRIQLAYRYGGEAPILTVRAAGHLDLKASITDGFYQQNDGAAFNNPGKATTPTDPTNPTNPTDPTNPTEPSNPTNPTNPTDPGTPPDNGYTDAVAAYKTADQYLVDNGNLWNGSINLRDGDPDNAMTPGGGTADISKDPYYQPLQAPLQGQSTTYYTNYRQYLVEYGDGDNPAWAAAFSRANNVVGFLVYNPTTLAAPQPGSYTNYADYATDYESWLEGNFNVDNRAVTPSPILLPVDSDYAAWSQNYTAYIGGHDTYFRYVNARVGNRLSGSQLFYAPFAPKSDGSGAGAGSSPGTTPASGTSPAYDQSVASYQTIQSYFDQNGIWNGSINLRDGDPDNAMTPGGGTADISKDPYYQPLQAPLKTQTDAYYANYQQYLTEMGDGDNPAWAAAFTRANNVVGFLVYNPTTLAAPQPGSYANYADYATDYESWLEANFNVDNRGVTPSPILLPVDGDYATWSQNYTTYIGGHDTYFRYVNARVGNRLSGSQLFYAPFAPKSDAIASGPGDGGGGGGGSGGGDGSGGGGGSTTPVAVPPPAPNNSPSNMPSLGNPASFASATLLGGSSTSYRLVAGADTGATDPLATSATGTGDVRLAGHFAVQDTVTDATVVTPRSPYAGKTWLMPTTIRTGTGSIDVASAGDIAWVDTAAPATIYTAGEPAEGTTAGTDIGVLRPSERAPGAADTQPNMVVNGLVNPDRAGDLSLHATGDIRGIQSVTDTDGSLTKGTAGASISQYWWQWMQVGNAADGSRSSIDFSNFRQGVMSLGGNVDVQAGGTIGELSVSLPTTWYANEARDAITTVGGGDLAVHAGGDILSGAYFVARGKADIRADGRIGASAALSAVNVGNVTGLGDTVTPVSTLIGMQDTVATVSGRQGVDLGGVYNPSYYNSTGVFTALLPATHPDAQSYSARSALTVSALAGDLVFGSLSAPGLVFGAGGVAGPILPASLAMNAFGGDIDIRVNGELFPSASGNLSLLASGGIAFSRQTILDSLGTGFGLIDSDPTGMPNPLAPVPSQSIYLGVDDRTAQNAVYHDADGLHRDDVQPVRIYALGGDITDGLDAPNGFNYLSLVIYPAKQAFIQAGRDIVNLSLVGQHTRRADITRVRAGRDIYDTPYLANVSFYGPIPNAYHLAPSLLLGGPGAFLVDAGRDIGPFTSQTDVAAETQVGQASKPTGIQAVGNLYNPYLPHESAQILVNFGVGPGMDTAGFLARYLDGADGLPSLVPDLVDFMQRRLAGTVTDTGHVGDEIAVTLTAEQARSLFAQQPDDVQQLFAQKALFKLLAQVGADYNNPESRYVSQYARGYAAVDAMFPASHGYTANGTGQGGLNGATNPVDTGNLDMRSSTIQTQQGGDVTILGPGGQALVGSTGAPSQIVDVNGRVLAGPNTMGVLTLETGSVNLFTDKSVLLAQSRIFTERGGDVTIWSSNGDINAGQGAKTTAEVPPPVYVCDVDAWCRVDARGQVAGAGIATLQTVEGAAAGNAYLIAPRGTVDAGDAGIRVAGNLVIAAARVANADNIQVTGESVGVPVTASVNIGALNAASAAATAATKAAEDVVRKQQAETRDKLPSEISVQVLRDGDTTSSIAPARGYDVGSPVQVLGHQAAGDARLTDDERRALRQL